MKILVTAFEPFLGESINPSQNVLGRLQISNDLKLVLPVAYDLSFIQLQKKLSEVSPDFVLMLGQAKGRAKICLERVALNLEDSSFPDAVGTVRTAARIFENSENAFFTALPLDRWSNALSKKGFEIQVSNNAGAYIRNSLYYKTVARFRQPSLFVHLPLQMEQCVGENKNAPGLSLEHMIATISGLIDQIQTDRQEF